jgi:pimeloyl-ACP methyl ester carboxylesterase
VAGALESAAFATLLLDLLMPDEESVDQRTREYRFNIDMLGEGGGRHRLDANPARPPRPASRTVWCQHRRRGGADAAAARPDAVRAVISGGGRPDLADRALPNVQAPALLIVGGYDEPVIEMNRDAMRRMRAPVELEIVPGATHLFDERGALEQVTRLATDWCRRHLGAKA